MKYEIGNPSDKCFLIADDPKVAAACVLLLGDGEYFCVDTESGESIPGTFFALGGDVNKTWEAAYGVGFEEFIHTPGNKKLMGICFGSFHYADKRTSLNDIGYRAKIYSKAIAR